jgi:hypothetical protein
MHLGVPFIAPRQLGAVESIPGRQILPSVAWRTGQSGAPPDTVRCGFLSFYGAVDRCRSRAVGAPDTVRCTPDTVRCTPDSPVLPSDRWLGHTSRADYAVAPPDSPVNFSHTSTTKPESSQFARASLAHRTLSGAPRLS